MSAAPITITGVIDVPGKVDHYAFRLELDSRIVFDSLTNNPAFFWTLEGPRGVVVSRRSFTASDGFGPGGNAVLELVPGNYRLTVEADKDNTGDYQFGLINVSMATLITPGAPITGRLDPANGTDAYQISVIAGQRYYFDLQSADSNQASWRLLDPYGRAIFGPSYWASQTDVDVLALPITGSYTLLVEGDIDPAGTTSYRLLVQRVMDEVKPMQLGVSQGHGVLWAQGRQSSAVALSRGQYIEVPGNASVDLTQSLTLEIWFKVDRAYSWGKLAYIGDGDDDNPCSLVIADGGLYLFSGDESYDEVYTDADELRAGQWYHAACVIDRVSGQTHLYLDGEHMGSGTTGAAPAPPTPKPLRIGVLDAEIDEVRLWSTARSQAEIQASMDDALVGDEAGLELYLRLDEGAGSALTDTTGKHTGEIRSVYQATPAAIASKLDHAGQQHRYTFTLSGPSRLYFDALTNNSSFYWSLSGTRGAIAGPRSFAWTGAWYQYGNPILDLPADDYTLIIDGTDDTVGSYAFRLLDVAAASAIEPGTAIVRHLESSSRTEVFQLDAAAGESFYLDVQDVTGPAPFWQLIDPNGQVLFGAIMEDVELRALAVSGAYMLLIDGMSNDTDTTEYQFCVQEVLDVTASLTVGARTEGVLDHAGKQDRYTFTLPGPAQLIFDALAGHTLLTWSLTGPRGTIVNARSFVASDSAGLDGSPLLDLVAGDYTLLVDGSGDATGAYAFRLLDVAPATAIAAGTPVAGQLDPGCETRAYRLSAGAGDQLYFERLSVTGGSPSWRLLEPYGRVVFGPTSFADVDVQTLALNGVYTLLVEGSLEDAGTLVDYSFNVDYRGNVPVAPLPAGTPITIGQTIDAAFDAEGTKDHYRFTLAGPAQLYFDVLSGSDAAWSLRGPRGTVIDGRSFAASDSAGLQGNPLLELVDGDYALTVERLSTTAYSFRLLDVGDATEIVPGTMVGGYFSPASTTQIYKLNAQPGDGYYFEVHNWAYTVMAWRLVDPNGRLVFGPANIYDWSMHQFELRGVTSSGAFTLLIEGTPYNPYWWYDDTLNYALNVQNLVDADVVSTLTIGVTTTGTIDNIGQQTKYLFTLASATRLYLDALNSASGICWTLTGPRGTIVSDRPLASDDWGYDQFQFNQLLDLVAGDYTLTIRGYGSATGSYAFRLLDVASATAIVLGTPVDAQLDPASGANMYQFTASAGDRFYIHLQIVMGGWGAYLQLLDPYGQLLLDSSWIDVVAAPVTGTYLLLVEGDTYASDTTSYSVNVQSVVDGFATLTLGVPVSEAIDHAGQERRYSFTLPAAARVYFDARTSNPAFTWSLSGPRGPEISALSFTASDSAHLYGNPLLELVAGDYTLVIDGYADTVGSYAFCLLDAAAAIPIVFGTPVTAQLDPASATLAYSFHADAGDELLFDQQSISGDTRTYWRLIDPGGKVIFGPTQMTGDVGPKTLTTAGSYVLLIEGAHNAVGTTTYMFIVQKMVDVVRALSLGVTATGTFSTIDRQHQYTFSLLATARLYFDALISSGQLKWSLNGPQGPIVIDRSFSSSDSNNLSGSPVLVPVAGDYSLTIKRNGVDNYAFRLLDMAAATAIVPGTTFSGQLDPASATNLYKFSAVAGEQYYFDRKSVSGTTSYWRLLDPYDQVVFGPSYMSSDVDVVILPFDGTYTLLVEGQRNATGTVSYTINVQRVIDTHASLTLGAVTSATLDHVGQRVHFALTLPSRTRVYFDALAASAGLTWSLAGPRGALVSGRAFSGSDSSSLSGNPLLDLVAGDYTLTIDATGDTLGSCAFRLLDVAAATALVPGTPVSGQLDPASKTEMYRFDAGAGDRFYFDIQSLNDGSVYWRLLDPYGQVVFGPVWADDRDVEALSLGGSYTLLIEGTFQASGVRSYQLNVQPVIDEVAPLSLGVTTTGSIAHTGQQDVYLFTLAGPARLCFDALSNTPSHRWRLSGPRGRVVDWRVLTSSDSTLSGSPLLDLVAGDYTLTIDGVDDATGAYAFRLLDLSTAAALTPGTAVSGQLNPGSETRAYQFSAAVGDRFSFLRQGLSGGSPSWRLLDPYGRVVFGPTSFSNVATQTLYYAGAYILLLEGRTADSGGLVDFSFNVQPEGNVAVPPMPVGTAMTLGTTVVGAITSSGSPKHHSLSLAGPAQVYMDLLSSTSASWSLTGPRGAIISNRAFSSSDSGQIAGNPLIDLVAGDYNISISGSSGVSYSFRLLDVATATEIQTGTTIAGTLNPANQTHLYRFNGTSGQRIYFDRKSEYTGAISWRLVDPVGDLVFGPVWLDDVDVKTLTRSGSYTLLIEGVYYASGSAIYSFCLQAIADDVAALNLGATISGTIGHAGQQDLYEFTLANDTQVYFDSLTSQGGFTWSLTGPRGPVVSARGFTSSDGWAQGGNPLLDLVAGAYTLVVDANADTIGSYAFRLLDAAAAPAIVRGAAIDVELDPASSTAICRLDAAQGDRIYVDVISTSGPTPSWRLLNPYGALVFGLASLGDIDVKQLTFSGAYVLLIEGSVSATGTATVRFLVQSVADDLAGLTLGAVTAGTIAHPGQQDRYTFTLTGDARLYFDSLTHSDSFNWSLSGPRGKVVDKRDFASTNASQWFNPVLELVAGDYTITVDGSGDTVGDYGFRLLDVGSATTIVPGTTIAGQLSPANETDIYQFAVTAGERFYFDARTISGSQPRWRLIDPYGRVIFGPSNMDDVHPPAFTVAGTYTLLIEGLSGSTDATSYAFNVVPTPLTQAIEIQGLEPQPGPDLVVSGVTVIGEQGVLRSGDNVTVTWSLVNQGNLPAQGSWQDRVTVRNAERDELIGTWIVLYDEATEGALQPNEARQRQMNFTLPDGNRGAGNILVQVATDITNALAERGTGVAGEANNSASVTVPSALRPYADLQVSNLTVDPVGGWAAGSVVTLRWRVTNTGSAPVTTSWADLVSVRNTTRNQTLLTQSLAHDISAGAPIEGGGFVDRELAITWPAGQIGSGRFELSVVTDSGGQIFENNAADTAETNNGASLTVTSAPDLLVTDLHTTPASPQAGDPLVIHWDDLNGGAAPTASAWFDRVVVVNLTTGEQLVNSDIYHDPQQAGAGPIGPGQARSRSYTVQLPHGLRGAGQLQITITADQNRTGLTSVFESSATTDAEANNAAAITITSQPRPYPDLAVSALAVPGNVDAGALMSVSWTVTNIGQAATSAGWVDRVVLSADAIIGNSDDIILATILRGQPLEVGADYSQTTQVRVPARIQGTHRVAVIADPLGAILEPDTRVNNTAISAPITIAPTNADLVPVITTAPTQARAGSTIRVEWRVLNQGSAATDVDRWVDQLFLSSSPALDGGALLLGSLTHIGVLDVGGEYSAFMDVMLPRALSGQMYFLVRTDAFGSVFERSSTNNNTAAAGHPTAIAAEARPNLVVTNLQAPPVWRVGEPITLSYTVENTGEAVASTWLTEKVRLVDMGNPASSIELRTTSQNRTVDIGAGYTQTVSVTAPVTATAAWRLEVEADALKFVNEQSEADNIASQPITLIHPDVRVTAIGVQGVLQGGETVTVHWTTENVGTAEAAGVLEKVYLSRDGVVSAADIKLGEFTHASIAAGATSSAALSALLPPDAKGTYQLLVVTDAGAVLQETAAGEANNLGAAGIDVAEDAYADLAVTDVQVPAQVIDDPATVNISWTVTNQGAGPGRTHAWTDLVVFSPDNIVGNSDDIVLAQVRHEGGLAAGASYTGTATYTFGPAFSGRGRVFVRTDKMNEVWENQSDANNTGQAATNLDVMPIPYADLEVQSITIQGTAASGKPIGLTWTVVNNGIGITSTGSWSDQLWLSSNPNGTGIIKTYAAASHIGQLAPGAQYSRTVDITLPQGLQGTYYINVRTGGPFEFIHTDDNRAWLAIPISLSPSPDLFVESVSLPATAQEGSLIDVTWSVVNQGSARASGVWTDSVMLVPASGVGAQITLGSFDYDHGLDPGIRYTRTEQVRVPSRLQGVYRLRVVTNANLGTSSDKQVYEHGAAAANNSQLSSGTADVTLTARPDLRVSEAEVPAHVTAGTSAAIRYSIANMGAAATSSRWTDRVYLSLDGTLSADDTLVGQYENDAALAPTESYANESASVNIPIRFRGDAYLLVVADANNKIDEYPNEANNIKAVKFYVDPIPFADLVTSDVVAPDQALHGSAVDVDYKVTNRGSDTTRGDSAGVDSWTDSVWLARDKTRPRTSRGDRLLGTVTHKGHLAVGEDYLGKLSVTIPEGVLSGQYYLTVWSDTYDVILEDALASNINLDDPNQLDSSNYKARPIAIIGITPPDLSVVALSAVIESGTDAGRSCSFSYTVQNRGDAYTGEWADEVYICNQPDLALATERWRIGAFKQKRSIGNGEVYTISQTVTLAPPVKGAHLVVKTDANPGYAPVVGDVKEVDETNNTRVSLVDAVAAPSDLQVTTVVTEPECFSGEQTVVTWTVTNHGAAVWAGTRGWIDSIYFSSDPDFIPKRAVALGAVVHANTAGLPAGASYTTSAKVTLPAGTDGPYYIYVLTDTEHRQGELTATPKERIEREIDVTEKNENALALYETSVHEGPRNDNNISSGTLNVTYREPDLQIDSIMVSDPDPSSGQPITVSWTVTNRGTRATRTHAWLDGVYLSRDASLDSADYPQIDRGTELELNTRTRQTVLTADGKPRYLQPGESYTNSATFNLPESISGQFYIIVKADTTTIKDYYRSVTSTIRSDLDVVTDKPALNAVGEFKDEGNNVASIPLTIHLAAPPDLTVTQVTAPPSVLAGQSSQVTYRVHNAGGNTPSDQHAWYEMVFLSKDRFLDVSQDRFLGYVSHSGGLTAGGSYDVTITVNAPRDLSGPYYVFVIVDPPRAWGAGDFGRVRELGKEQNNAATTEQPILIELPPPADLKVVDVVVPAQAEVGGVVTITFTVTNDSNHTAYGRWTDAVYLSSDNTWDIGDRRLGKVEHVGDLAGGVSYTATLQATLPPLKDGNWRVIVRPDVFNDVYEGTITYTDAGLNLPPGEANNRTASGASLQVQVPVLTVGSPLATTLTTGQSRVYKVTVAADETLRVRLDAGAKESDHELYVRYGDVPSGFAYDAAYSNPAAPDQQALIPSTRAGDYYILIKSRRSASGGAVTLRADLLPLAVTRVSPDRGGVGDDAHRWVTMDIRGARFRPGALVKLSRPGVFEVEPERWRVLDATHIRAVFDLRDAPHGLYDVSVTNPDGERVVEAHRFLVERGVEVDASIGVGGPRDLEPGAAGTYSVSLQSLTNVDTPYVRFDFGVCTMGDSEYVLGGLSLPYLVLGTNVGGRPDGRIVPGDGSDQSYGETPTTGTPRGDVPWARLDGSANRAGFELASGYALDLGADGFAGMSFIIQTYPGLKEWEAYDFESLRAKLYLQHPDWKEEGLLDGGVADLDKVADGLSHKFLSTDPEMHVDKLERLAIPFRFNVVYAATPLTRAEFVAEQTAYALRLRSAILGDAASPPGLATFAADETEWVKGWLRALEEAGLLRPDHEAPPIRRDAKVISLNAILACGILFGEGGGGFRTQADLAGLFAKVQAWYGDTSKWAGDSSASKAPIEYEEYREDNEGNSVEIPVPELFDAATLDRPAAKDAQVVNFNVFAGALTELEYLRHIGQLDEEFRPIGPNAIDLTRYLQQAALVAAADEATVSIRGPRGATDSAGNSYVPANTPLPYRIGFQNPTTHAVGELRIVTQLDAHLDPRSIRFSDLQLGDISVNVPRDKPGFQGELDFSGSKGFILRVSIGIDAETRIATWLLQAINPDSGEVSQDTLRGLLALSGDGASADDTRKRGYAGYTVRSLDTAASGASITASARVFFDDSPPLETAAVTCTLDAAPPQTTVAAVALGDNAEGAPTFHVEWNAVDDLSGVKHVTLYVAERGGELRIWLRQVPADQKQAVFTGEPGKTYEFLAVATDLAGNSEAAAISNAVLPDDGSRRAVLEALGTAEELTQTAELPLAAPDRSYPANALFEQSTQGLPGPVAPAQPADLQSVLAPFALRGFADGFAAGDADIGGLAMVELPDGRTLVSAGALRNEVFVFGEDGGRSVKPLFTLDAPVLDMAVDGVGQLWVMTGNELMMVDVDSGEIMSRAQGPGEIPLTHALAIHPDTGDLYVSSGRGIEILQPSAADPATAWRHFSNERVGDLAFGPDGRLWGVRWSGKEVPAAVPGSTVDIISFPMSGRSAGRAELEYRLSGVIDSIAFGIAGTALEGLLLVSSNLPQRPVVDAAPAPVPHDAAVWMIELQSRRILQLARGGTRGEAIVATRDGRVRVAQTGRIDEIAAISAPSVLATSVPEGALVPLPLNHISVVFDQAMWTGAGASSGAADPSSVLNPASFRFTTPGDASGQVVLPESITWNAKTRTAVLAMPGLRAGQYQLEVSSELRSATQMRLAVAYTTSFTALLNVSDRVLLAFRSTRARHSTGEVSYDISVTNTGTDDLHGPLVLLLDPGRSYKGSIAGSGHGTGEQSGLWVMDLSAGLQPPGDRLAVGATLENCTVTLRPAEPSGAAGAALLPELVKADLGHGVYAAPVQNALPTLRIVDAADIAGDVLPGATAGQAWTATLEAGDSDGTVFFWHLVQAPQGVTLTPSGVVESGAEGYRSRATLSWTPSPGDRADSEIVVRVQDSRGGVVTRLLKLNVAGGNRAPILGGPSEVTLTEGETLDLPLIPSDPDGDPLKVILKNLPQGAVFDAASGTLSWRPTYDQAGTYEDVTAIVTDGKATVRHSFRIIVAQGYASPRIEPIEQQTAREGDAFSLQIRGTMPGGLVQLDGTTIKLEYSAASLPGGASLNSETGLLTWTPGYAQAGTYRIPLTVTAIYTPPGAGAPVRTSASAELVIDVLNANGEPRFAPVETWNVREGQPLRISVFAFDPDNPSFEPKLRLSPLAPAVGPETTAPTVSYQVTGLPSGASFDSETMEIVWTPDHSQAGTYHVHVVATDDGGSTSIPKSSEITVPIVVSNSNRAPDIGAIENAIVDLGAVLEIPISATDIDGNPVEITIIGLPRFATYTQTSPSGASAATGVLRFAPGDGDRGDYTITVTAQDDGDGDARQALLQSKTFVVTARSATEAPVINAPAQIAAVVGQAISLPITVRDPDQDPLTWSAQGLPPGASLTPQVQYGHALLTWTPGAADIGIHDISIEVTDSGLGPVDAAYPPDPNVPPAPNTRAKTVRIVVRAENAAPEILGVQIDGTATEPTTGAVAVAAAEGVPLVIEVAARDLDLDHLQWTVTGLPSGMRFETQTGSAGSSSVILRWTPDAFAAQTAAEGGSPGLYHLIVKASDGAAAVEQSFEITVANTNLAPRILPVPLQIVREGDTLTFGVVAVDADGDTVTLSLVPDQSTPPGVHFDATTGTVEWTPTQDAVDNADGSEDP